MQFNEMPSWAVWVHIDGRWRRDRSVRAVNRDDALGIAMADAMCPVRVEPHEPDRTSFYYRHGVV